MMHMYILRVVILLYTDIELQDFKHIWQLTESVICIALQHVLLHRLPYKQRIGKNPEPQCSRYSVCHTATLVNANDWSMRSQQAATRLLYRN